MIMKCDDCEAFAVVTLAPYGESYMAEIECIECGISYDTNLSDEDINYLRQEN
jgi:Zn ribbon nucleic-acid-binding protein